MKLRLNSLNSTSARLVAAAALSLTMVACGSGSGDGDLDPTDPDIVPVIGGGDGDEDPIIDGEPVVDGGGGDGLSEDGCEGGSGTDLDSSTADWADNCRIRVGGEHQRSTYSQGIQRIVWCRGHNAGNNDILAFADGDFGPISEEQVRQFQQAQQIDVDGVVGPETWGALQDVLFVLDNTAADRDTHEVQGEACPGVAQFYQQRALDGALTGWTMAVTPGNPEGIAFSVDPVQ